MPSVLDVDGVPIVVGARVEQLNVFDASAGAIAANAGCAGTVVDLGRTRAQVAFDGATAIRGFRATDEPMTHRVAGRLLRVLGRTSADVGASARAASEPEQGQVVAL